MPPAPTTLAIMNLKAWLATFFVVSLLAPTAHADGAGCICFKLFQSADKTVGCGLLWDYEVTNFVCDFAPAPWSSEISFECTAGYSCNVVFSEVADVGYLSPSGPTEFYVASDYSGNYNADVDCEDGQCDFMDNYNLCQG